jgi:hypothetical protein
MEQERRKFMRNLILISVLVVIIMVAILYANIVDDLNSTIDDFFNNG